MKRVLNVGGNSKQIPLPEFYAGWEHHLLDIDPTGQPDIVCDARNLLSLAAAQYESIYCSHNLEHYYRHDVPKVLAGFKHLLKPGGFVHIRVPDIGQVVAQMHQRNLDIDDELYVSSLGPISVLDVIYGWGAQIERSGCEFFAHKTGFTQKSLVAMLERCGFSQVFGTAVNLEVSVYAFVDEPPVEYRSLLNIGNSAPKVGAGGTALAGGATLKPGDVSFDGLQKQAKALAAEGKHNEAIALYQTWIDQTTLPLTYVAYFNMGCLQGIHISPAVAATTYERSLAIMPNFVPSLANLAANYEALGRTDDALDAWQKVCTLVADNEKVPAYREALRCSLNSVGRVLELRRDFPAAEAALARSVRLQAEQADVLHHWIHLRQKQCAWPVYQTLAGVKKSFMKASTSALAMLGLTDDPLLQLDAAKRYVNEVVPVLPPRLSPQAGYGHSRIRLGYLSANFGRHAVSILTTELFELHDRARFEVFAISMAPSDNSAMRKRVEAAFEHFLQLDDLPDEAVAKQIREAEIDILIDLQGLTQSVRPKILAYHPAPVQIAYLGFPGTSAMPWIDYILADDYLIPPGFEKYYSEKPLRMPGCFQSNDRQRAIGKTPSRAECGLPEDAFVFCAFNHNYKITPEMFAVWMRILAKTPNGVLWLLADNERAQQNMIAEATRQSIKTERLIFAPRVEPEQYLARFRQGDLFLDTFPFNGGTTASDVLWAGLPLLTYSGKTFASRMAGSLLRSLGLPELIAANFHEYEKKAIALANNPAQLAAIRERLAAAIPNASAFDTPRFVADLETLLTSVVK